MQEDLQQCRKAGTFRSVEERSGSDAMYCQSWRGNLGWRPRTYASGLKFGRWARHLNKTRSTWPPCQRRAHLPRRSPRLLSSSSFAPLSRLLGGRLGGGLSRLRSPGARGGWCAVCLCAATAALPWFPVREWAPWGWLVPPVVAWGPEGLGCRLPLCSDPRPPVVPCSGFSGPWGLGCRLPLCRLPAKGPPSSTSYHVTGGVRGT